MKERPILFSAPMVRAILDGRKTQTRRVVKGGEMAAIPFDRIPSEEIESLEIKGWREYVNGHLLPPCPYGQPGDRLWVRETWRSSLSGGFYRYKADHGSDAITKSLAKTHKEPWMKWKPSIHMPRWASRIMLEITSVRVERLQDISEADAQAEGVDQTNTSIRGYATERFTGLWQSINGDASWYDNPWVWVVEFKRVQP